MNFNIRYKDLCLYLDMNCSKFPNQRSDDKYKKSLGCWFNTQKSKIRKGDVELREKLSGDKRVKEKIDRYMDADMNFNIRYKDLCLYLDMNCSKFPNKRSDDKYKKSLGCWFNTQKSKIKKGDVELREKLSGDKRVKENIKNYMNKGS